MSVQHLVKLRRVNLEYSNFSIPGMAPNLRFMPDGDVTLQTTTGPKIVRFGCTIRFEAGKPFSGALQVNTADAHVDAIVPFDHAPLYMPLARSFLGQDQLVLNIFTVGHLDLTAGNSFPVLQLTFSAFFTVS
jgi:hypothetical protein